jgi:hypothetical protein
MLRLRTFFAALLLAAIAGSAPAAMADVCGNGGGTYVAGTLKIQTMIAGSSAMWQSMALGAYNTGSSIVNGSTTHHYVMTSKNGNLVDTRPTALSGGSSVTSTDRAWIVWDGVVSGTKCNSNIWAYVKADSVIGNRALFGSIGNGQTKGVYLEIPQGGSFPADDTGHQISNTLWGDGTVGVVPPAAIQALFSSTHEGTVGAPNLINVAATDIDPADAYYASNRVNSVGDSTNGDQGLGFGTNAVGTPPSFGSTLAQLVGTPIKGDLAADTPFPVLAFNLSGTDPFTNANLPSFTTISVGASPIVVIHSNLVAAGTTGSLSGLTDASEAEIGRVFSGVGGNGAGAFSDCPACAGFVSYAREPLSGTYNTFEETIARHPSSLSVYRYSQEKGNSNQGGTVINNPLAGTSGYRYRAIGTGDEVTSVQTSTTIHTGQDGIGYTFFSFGNVSPIANSASYSYITINGIDPLFHNYVPGSVGITDPIQPAKGLLPNSTTNLPATGCASGAQAFPCDESLLWAADNYAQVNGATVASYSFPNVRNGSYPSWSLLRLVAAGAASAATALVNASNTYVVTTVPDYVPFNPVVSPIDGTTIIDPGLQVLRSHFGCDAQTCGTNSFTGAPNDPSQGAVERGRDAGGAILSFLDSTTELTQDGVGVVSFQ